jgi:hypothetical protein
MFPFDIAHELAITAADLFLLHPFADPDELDDAVADRHSSTLRKWSIIAACSLETSAGRALHPSNTSVAAL